MKKYKTTITKEYTIDILANTEKEAQYLSLQYLDVMMLSGTEHHYKTGDTVITSYDVTNTDDSFYPLNV